jgi:hypothetical protein
MRITIAICAALWLGLGPAWAAEKTDGKPGHGVLDGVLRRGRMAAGRMHPKCTGMGLELAPGVSRTAKAVKNGVELVLTSTDTAAAAKLQEEAPAYFALKKDTDCGCCPAAVPGAKAKVKKIAGGVKVTITAPTPEAAVKLREMAGLKPEPPVKK